LHETGIDIENHQRREDHRWQLKGSSAVSV
jgi:hypothetical protein